jgi:hypothetical protein
MKIPFFVILTFTLSWPIMLYGFGFADSLVVRDICASLGMLAVGLSAVITKLFVEKGNVSEFGFSKGKLKWYLVLAGLSIIFGCVYLRYKSIFLNSYLHGLFIGVRDSLLILLGVSIFSLPVTAIATIIFCLISVRWVTKQDGEDDM